MANGSKKETPKSKAPKTPTKITMTMGDLKRSASVALQPLGKVSNLAKVSVEVL